jgi:hypothetical protein
LWYFNYIVANPTMIVNMIVNVIRTGRPNLIK